MCLGAADYARTKMCLCLLCALTIITIVTIIIIIIICDYVRSKCK